MKMQIRFNTEKDKRDQSLPPWRVLIQGQEYLAEKVVINTQAWTTSDEIAPGVLKWHISCDGEPKWGEGFKTCVIS